MIDTQQLADMKAAIEKLQGAPKEWALIDPQGRVYVGSPAEMTQVLLRHPPPTAAVDGSEVLILQHHPLANLNRLGERSAPDALLVLKDDRELPLARVITFQFGGENGSTDSCRQPLAGAEIFELDEVAGGDGVDLADGLFVHTAPHGVS